MAHHSAEVANALLEQSGPNGLDPMKLLKLTYLCQGWMLGLYDIPLIWNDVEAWRYGPVFKELYRFVAGKHQISVQLPSPSAAQFDAREQHLIDQVWEKYGNMSGLKLSSLTHAEGTPWYITYHQFGQNSVIPKSLIRDYYSERAA